MQKFGLCLYLSFLHLKPNFRDLSLSFDQLSWSRTTDKLAINWKSFAQVRLHPKFTFIIFVWAKITVCAVLTSLKCPMEKDNLTFSGF